MEVADEKTYGQYDFKPKINSISATIAAHRTIDDLCSTSETEQRKEKLRKELLEKENQKCSFQPQTN